MCLVAAVRTRTSSSARRCTRRLGLGRDDLNLRQSEDPSDEPAKCAGAVQAQEPRLGLLRTVTVRGDPVCNTNGCFVLGSMSRFPCDHRRLSLHTCPITQRQFQAELSHSGLSSWTKTAAVNGHSTVGPEYERFTLKTGYSAIFDYLPAATNQMGKAIAGPCQDDGLAQIVRGLICVT